MILPVIREVLDDHFGISLFCHDWEWEHFLKLQIKSVSGGAGGLRLMGNNLWEVALCMTPNWSCRRNG